MGRVPGGGGTRQTRRAAAGERSCGREQGKSAIESGLLRLFRQMRGLRLLRRSGPIRTGGLLLLIGEGDHGRRERWLMRAAAVARTTRAASYARPASNGARDVARVCVVGQP